MQFDVFPNPATRVRASYPYIVLMQSDRADTGANRTIAFLAPSSGLKMSDQLVPVVDVNGARFVLLLSPLMNIAASELKRPIANLFTYREKIVAGLDWLFSDLVIRLFSL